MTYLSPILYRRVASFLLAFLLGIAATTSMAADPPGLREAIARHENAQATISNRLYHSNIPRADPASYDFESALFDLNGDGVEDAIVLFKGDYCGTGGCTMRVFRGTQHGYEFTSGTLRVYGPIRVLTNNSSERHGWKTLIVQLRDVGSVLLQYNGKRYPLVPPDNLKATQAQVDSAKVIIK